MRMSYLRLLFHVMLTGCILSCPGILQAQTDTVKVGLVLSGGGAKGMAHLGVLKVLEEEKVWPCCISGTSIGSIVGAYYAAGYTADEIRENFNRTDFDALMLDQLPRRYLPLYLKQTGRNEFFYFPLDLKHWTLRLPGGFSHSQLFFNKLFEDLYAIQYVENYDSLPVRVRFVATDLVTGKSVVFRHGSIPRAVVASSAIPSIVSPLKIDGKLLSDGGVVNNYPLEQVKEMGARTVIGSDVQGTLLKASEIQSIADILDQIMSIHMYADMPLKRRQTDIYLRPPVMNFSVTDFSNMDTLYRLGYREALRHKSSFRRYARPGMPLRPKRVRHPDTLVFRDIIITNPANAKQKELILWKTGFQAGHKIAFKDFINGINYLYGTGDYDQIHYWVKPGDTLVMNLVTDTVRFKFKTAFHYSPLQRLELLAGFTGKRLLTDHDVLDLEMIAGSQFRYNLNYLIDNGYHMGFGWHSSWHHWEKNVGFRLMFPEVENPSFQQMDLHTSIWTNRLFFQGIASTNVNFHVGLEHRKSIMNTSIFSGERPNLKYYFDRTDNYGMFVSFFYDDLNDYYFPEYGIRITADYHHFFASDNTYEKPNPFHRVSLAVTASRLHGKHLSSSYILASSVVTGDSIAPSSYTYVGGMAAFVPTTMLQPFYSRPYMDFRTSGFVFFQPQLQYRWHKNHFFRLGVQSILYEKPPQRLKQYGFNYNLYFRYGFRSYFGPIFVTLAWEPVTGRWNTGMEIGFRF